MTSFKKFKPAASFLSSLLFICVFGYSTQVCAALTIDHYVIVAVDPSDILVNTTVLHPASAAKSFEVTGIKKGTDLDLGWNDYLDMSVRVPKKYTGGIAVQFGTTTHPGFSEDRVIGVPAESVIADGTFHTYRLDLGLVVWWRDSLSDIRIIPASGTAKLEIKKVEVGDIPNDVYQVNRDINPYKAKGETVDDCSYMESKHAVTWWSPLSFSNHPSFKPEVEGRRALRMIEEAYQVYCKKLGYTEPFEDTTGKRPGRFKVNHTTWYGGFWMGSQNGSRIRP